MFRGNLSLDKDIDMQMIRYINTYIHKFSPEKLCSILHEHVGLEGIYISLSQAVAMFLSGITDNSILITVRNGKLSIEY